MKTETSTYTKETRFRVGDEIIEIDRYGENNYTIIFPGHDYSAGGTLLDILKELHKAGFDLSTAVPVPGEGMTTYRLFYDERGVQNLQVRDVEGKDLEDALCRFAQACIEEDHTGIFFPLADADIDELEKEEGFHKVEVGGEHLGIVLADHTIVS